MSIAWSIIEIELILTDYFHMLAKELQGERYVKAEYCKALLSLLNKRSEGSIQFKHQNISAILIELGQFFIRGYLPRYNYQQSLKEAVIHYLAQHLSLEGTFKAFAESKIVALNKTLSYDKLLAEAPKSNIIKEPKADYRRSPFKINYLEKEQMNHKLGHLGEELVMNYERWKLVQSGMEKWVDKVRWISKDEGDGAGFDILSVLPNGNDQYIEVKTTRLSKETPIFFSKNELDFSIEHKGDFHLYRVFNFEKNAKMFIKQGALNQICNPVATSFKGYF